MRGIFLTCGLSIIGLDETELVYGMGILLSHHIFGILMTSTLAWEATPAYVIRVTRETSAAIGKSCPMDL
jgi:hypothetical protein